MTTELIFVFGEDSYLINVIMLPTESKDEQTAMLENRYLYEKQLLSSMTKKPKGCFCSKLKEVSNLVHATMF
jgi:hypothetical protein